MKAIAPLLLCLSLSSCIIDASGVRSGCRTIPSATLEQIKPGSTPEYVESLLGQPSSRSASGEKFVFWLYEGQNKNTYVLFEDGRVSKTWQD